MSIIAFLSASLIYFSMRKVKVGKIYVVLWGVADLLGLIFSNIFFMDTININFLNAIYVIPNNLQKSGKLEPAAANH